MKKYDEILKPCYIDRIFAHTSNGKPPETLITHSENTLRYCDLLIEKLHLDKNLNTLLSVLEMPIHDTIELIRHIVYYHDLGKVNPVFQKEKMKNNLEITADNLDSNHSFYGKILFDNLFFDKWEDNDLFFLLSQTIDRHHTPLKDIDFLYGKMMDNENNIAKQLGDLDKISNQLFNDCHPLPPVDNWCNKYNFKNEQSRDIRKIFDTDEKQEALFYLYKMVYSLLVTSDYYATVEHMQGLTYMDKISTLNKELIERCKNSFFNHSFNKKLQNLNYNTVKKSNLSEINDLDKLRTRILVESNDRLKKHISNSENRVFYLNVPTGGGKTNISLQLVITLLQSKPDINRVFYVFPFISLIEQNYSVVQDTLGLSDDLSPIYSSSKWNVKSNDKEEQLQYVLDNEFFNHPFVVMSNVNFFNTFIKSSKSVNYRLVNLANSIVVLDEIQSLSDKKWELFNDVIRFASKYLNIYFVIMSATLPKLDALSDGTKSDFALNLIENPDDYFEHDKFKNRVSITYRPDITSLTELQSTLKTELSNTSPDQKLEKILVVVNTVRASLELYKMIKSDEIIQKMGFDVCLLNSTILSHRRQEIIDKLKTDSKTILVSTQSVEAGMDIDCDLGIRDFAIFDSVEQIAGRINRNSNPEKESSKLIVTHLKEQDKASADTVYGGSYRWMTTMSEFDESSVSSFFKKRDFNSFYSKVLQQIKDRSGNMIRKSTHIKNGIRHMDFEELNKIDVIDQDDSVSVMVDVLIPRKEFTEQELGAIQCKEPSISGRYVWEKYNEFAANFKHGHVEKKINTKIWSSLISKFTINISKNVSLCNVEGIPLLEEQYYSYEEGFDKSVI